MMRTTGQPLTNGGDQTWGQFDQNVQYDSFGQAIDPGDRQCAATAE
jgi:hypothetical protein